jgi:hypothetical protein
MTCTRLPDHTRAAARSGRRCEFAGWGSRSTGRRLNASQSLAIVVVNFHEAASKEFVNVRRACDARPIRPMGAGLA